MEVLGEAVVGDEDCVGFLFDDAVIGWFQTCGIGAGGHIKDNREPAFADFRYDPCAVPVKPDRIKRKGCGVRFLAVRGTEPGHRFAGRSGTDCNEDEKQDDRWNSFAPDCHGMHTLFNRLK